ncbi:hypothetical protein JCM14076_18910 [Methylosoma difficile]
MARYFPNTKTEISPCILAQERFKLGFTPIKPTNKKSCSDDYRNKVRTVLIDTQNFTR